MRHNTALLLVLLYPMVSLTVGCKSEKATPPATNPSAAQGNQAQLTVDDLVAPIALYPDQLLAQLLTASMDPQEVLDGGNWLLQNQNLKGDALINAVKKAGFSLSMQYLMAFPQVVDNMCQEMAWTTQLGEAFKADQKGVMDAIQRKRAQAQQMGNLTSSPQMTVENKRSDNGQQYVEIKPADPKVVYVPQYNPVIIYNTPAPAAPAPAATASSTATEKSGVSTGEAVAIGLLSFGVGMAVGSALHSNNYYYYPYPAWGYGGVYYGGRPYYPPPYRPAYPAYRPAYGYNPPPNYRWNQYNKNVNVNINNNYYSKFQNQNRPAQLPANTQLGGSVRTPSTLPGNASAGQGGQPSWKGQATYQGAKPNTMQGQQPGASMARAAPPNMGPGSAANRPANLGAGAGSIPPRPSTQPNVGRPSGTIGVGAARRTGPSTGNMAARPSPSPNVSRGGDRGYAAPSSASAPRPPASPSASPTMQSRGGNAAGAFAGSSSGASDRAASSRGRSSMGASGGGGRRR
jgi:hypothetical protein